ncbi:hypothetical protein QTL97_04085 [Sporosarcina thermotolerans]|uniref:Uncharacterized protein n=1 Tax=Sporosarcina thermotolerans TaxID=633404 RepID=A0AAW9A4S9_9BACL|nr:hypothetical protein [Sporosarcina thermotolerans]MDW0116102.1 hypothetical protein [Sporosarcina thermotolerans]WHT48071.1 hypothetical protein QNH10_18865 [Sporosarcina thermotolerans]
MDTIIIVFTISLLGIGLVAIRRFAVKVGLVLVAGILAGCSEKAPISQPESEIVDEGVSEPEVDVNGEDGVFISLKAAKEHAIATIRVRSGEAVGDVYIISTESLSSITGKEQAPKEGSYALFLAEDGAKEAEFQVQVDGLLIDPEEALGTYTFGEYTIFSLARQETTKLNLITAWAYDGEKLKEIQFDGKVEVQASHPTFRAIEDSYLQMYLDSEDTMDAVPGWTFTTWKWHPEKMSFAFHFERSYTDQEEFGLASGEYLAGKWHEYQHFYLAFPQYTFTDQSTALLSEGMFINQNVQLGQPIDKLLQERNDWVGHDYYEGGPYYEFPGGYTYFYNEGTQDVSFIVYRKWH